MKPKNPRPKCPRCHEAMRNVYIRNSNYMVKLGFYCFRCNKVKLKLGIKLIHDPIFKGLNEVFS